MLGSGPAAYEKAVQGLTEWQAHRALRIRVHPSDAPITEGSTVALALPLAGIFILAACRIVAVINESDRFGFAYGTLRSHPEQGEEAFIVSTAEGVVRFEIRALSRPSDPIAKIGSPLARRLQRRATRGYLGGLATYVARG